jgi:hypothetical protein
VWWWNDADNLLLRAPFDTTAQTGAIAATLASGGVWLLGDGFDQLSDDTLDRALDPAIVALRGATVTPTDPLEFVSGVDAGPFMEAALPDDAVPTRWVLGDGAEVLLNLGDAAVTVRGPGGVELFSGLSADPGVRTLQPGAGEVWVP